MYLSAFVTNWRALFFTIYNLYLLEREGSGFPRDCWVNEGWENGGYVKFEFVVLA